MRIRYFVVIFLALLAACGPSSRPVRPDDTQVVAQWRLPDDAGWFWSVREFIWESRLDSACADLCNFDGNDIGRGKLNLFLNTEDVPKTVQMLIEMERAGRLPPGMRIGVAQYRDKARKDWGYVSVYPKRRGQFALF